MPGQGVLQPFVRNPSVLDGVNERLERRHLHVDVTAAPDTADHHLAAGSNRLHGRIRHRVGRGDRLHLEIVAEDDALETQLVAQQVVDDAARQRRRLLLVNRRHEDVGGHDKSHLGRNRLPERDGLDAADAIGRMLDERKLEMGVNRRVPMPRKVLSACGDAVILQAANNGGAQLPHHRGIVGERAIANDRVLRVGVNVQDGRVVERDADGLEFGGERRGEPRRQRHVACPPQRRHRRPLGERRAQAGDASPFLVDADPQRRF